MPRLQRVTGLDIGSSKVCAVVAEVDEYGELSVTGVGEAPSDGLRKGVVVNLDRTARSIRSAVDQAERMSGVRIESVVVGVAGSHIASQNSHGLISVARSDREIGAEEVQRVLEAARAVELPADRELLHVIPRAFTVDGQAGVRDAIGLSGARLEVDTHIVTGSAAAVQNVVKAVHQAGLNLDDLVLQGLASSEAVLSDSEAELGAAVVDIGAGTTDVVVYAQGAVLHTAVIPVGGNHVTSDIAIGLRTSLGDAESMKINYGHAVSDAIESEELVEVRQGGGEQVTAVSRRLLADVIGPRARETFGLVQQEIRRSGREGFLPAGVVLTGGGAKLMGTTEIAQAILGLPVRLGFPSAMTGFSDKVSGPGYATAVGLVRWGLRADRKAGARFQAPGPVQDVYRRAMGWIREFF